MNLRLQSFALFASLAFSATAFAVPIVSTGNTPQMDENVLLNSGETGTTVQGTLNQSGGLVNFTSTTVLLSPSSGQARVDVADETDPFNSLTFSLANDATFTSAIFNIFGDSGMVDISVSYIMADGSPLVTSFDTANGSNFFTIVGNGSLLTGITLTTDGSFGDLRQIRIGGYAKNPPAVNVPDTGLSLMLVSLGLVSLAAFRRTRR